MLEQKKLGFYEESIIEIRRNPLGSSELGDWLNSADEFGSYTIRFSDRSDDHTIEEMEERLIAFLSQYKQATGAGNNFWYHAMLVRNNKTRRVHAHVKVSHKPLLDRRSKITGRLTWRAPIYLLMQNQDFEINDDDAKFRPVDRQHAYKTLRWINRKRKSKKDIQRMAEYCTEQGQRTKHGKDIETHEFHNLPLKRQRATKRNWSLRTYNSWIVLTLLIRYWQRTGRAFIESTKSRANVASTRLHTILG